MNAKEYMNEHFTKQQLIDKLPIYNCPSDFGFDTKLSSNKDFCNDSDQGDCEKCWNSEVVK